MPTNAWFCPKHLIGIVHGDSCMIVKTQAAPPPFVIAGNTTVEGSLLLVVVWRPALL